MKLALKLIISVAVWAYFKFLTVKESKKLKEKMPDGWRWGDDPFARYKKCGIKVWGQD